MGCCIYKIVNKVNGKVYVGASDLSRNPRDSMKRRWEEHKRCARLGIQKVLYDDMRKFGIENFYVRFVEACPDQKTMYAREIEVINELNSWNPNGYNIRKGRKAKA